MSLANFMSYDTIKEIVVNFPNCTKTKAIHKGIIQLRDETILKDVLFIPDFKYKLVLHFDVQVNKII